MFLEPPLNDGEERESRGRKAAEAKRGEVLIEPKGSRPRHGLNDSKRFKSGER